MAQDGAWIDREFYNAVNRKSQPKQSKNNAIYGVFGDEDDSFQTSTVDITKPVSFVSAGTHELDPTSFDEAVASRLEREEEEKDALRAKMDEEEEEEEDTRMQGVEGLGFSSFGRQGRAEQQRRSEREQVQRKARQVSDMRKHIHQDFGTFETHTKGIGMKLLLKWGFKGRLGKKEQGIANPIVPQQRPPKMGLHYGGRTEKAEGGAPVGSPELEDSKARSRRKQEHRKKLEAERQRRAKHWKKGAVRVKRVYKTAAELAAESVAVESTDKAIAPDTGMVVDMRGSTPRLGNIEQLSELLHDKPAVDPVASTEEAAVVSAIPELSYNLRLLVEVLEPDIRKLHRRLQHCKDTLVALEHSETKLKEEEKEEKERTKSLESVLALLDGLDEQLRLNKKQSLPQKLSMIADTMDELQHKHSVQFRVFNLSALSLTFGLPLLKKFVAAWFPCREATEHSKSTEEVALILRRWQALLSQSGVGSERKRRKKAMRWSQHDLYSTLLRQTVLNKLCTSIAAEWDVHNPAPLLEVWRVLKPCLPSLLQATVHERLVARLLAGVTNWDPRSDPTPVHVWIHPWTPVVADSLLQPVYSAVRKKLAMCLVQWHPSDGSARAVVVPWKDVFREEDFSQFLEQHIVPKLQTSLQREFTVNPLNQDLTSLNWTLDWSNVLPFRRLAHLLLAEFFPKWFHALYSWLIAGPDFDEVRRWLVGWTSAFPEGIVQTTSVATQFQTGTKLIAAAERGASLGPLLRGVMVELQKSISTGVKQAPVPPPRPMQRESRVMTELREEHEEEEEMGSFKEIVQKFAEMHNLSFLPNLRRGRVDGNQVYSFGRLSIYLDNGCIYAYSKAANQAQGCWEPLALDELVQRA